MMKPIFIVLLAVVILFVLYLVVSALLTARRRNQIDRILIDKIVDYVLQHWGASRAAHGWEEPEDIFLETEEETSPLTDSIEKQEGTDNQIDERFEDAARFVVATQSGLRSDLQRNLALGYARAGRILDQLEAAGIVGPENGKEPREVLVKDSEELEGILSGFGPLRDLQINEPPFPEPKASVDDIYWELMHE